MPATTAGRVGGSTFQVKKNTSSLQTNHQNQRDRYQTDHHVHTHHHISIVPSTTYHPIFPTYTPPIVLAADFLDVALFMSVTLIVLIWSYSGKQND